LSRHAPFLASLVTLAVLVVVLGLAAGRAELHVDDTEHLHVAARLAAGERLYVDVFQKQAGPFWTLLGPVLRAADGDGGAAVTIARAAMAAAALGALLALAALARALGASRWGALAAPLVALASPNLVRMLVLVRPDAPMWALALGGLAALARHAVAPARRRLVAAGALLGLAVVLLLKAAPLAALALAVVAWQAPRGRRARDLADFGAALAAPVLAWLALEAALGRLEWAAFFAGRFNAAFYAAPGSPGDTWGGLAAVALAEIARVEPWMLGLAPVAALWLAARAAHPADDPGVARAARVAALLPAAGAAVLAATALPFESYFMPFELAAAAAAPPLVEALSRRGPARAARGARAAGIGLTVALARHADGLTLSAPVARQYATWMSFEARGAEVRHYPVFPDESTPARYARRLWYRGPMRARALTAFCRLDAADAVPAAIRAAWTPEYREACGDPAVR